MAVIRQLCFSYHLNKHQKSKPSSRPRYRVESMVTPEDAGILPPPEDDATDRVLESEDTISFHMLDEENGGLLSMSMELSEGRTARVGMVWREKV